ncbi:hypothetical protein GCM10011428_60190 [Streptomyces violaceus]
MDAYHKGGGPRCSWCLHRRRSPSPNSAGLSLLTASITGGLAALLALFTVTDATVRDQRITTALLPIAGFPVLAFATTLHGITPARDAAFLAVVFCGVYARRWGPRGHALGIFAFMNFFITQFLHAVPAQMPELYTAVGLALFTAGATRFVLWPIERHTPPAAAPPALPGSGLARPTTRQAFQVTAASALALLAGQLLSEERWYWAVGTVWWIFVNTASRGETLVRGFRRVFGTVIGIVVGLLVAVPLHGAPAPTAALVALCVFGIFYTAAVSYSWMMLAVTVMVSLLYGLLGVLDPSLLGLRLAETGVGALCARWPWSSSCRSPRTPQTTPGSGGHCSASTRPPPKRPLASRETLRATLPRTPPSWNCCSAGYGWHWPH